LRALVKLSRWRLPTVRSLARDSSKIPAFSPSPKMY
jgi:hypothetical protein